MASHVPIAIREAVADIISREAPAAITGFTPAQGGCINNGGRLQTNTPHPSWREFFVTQRLTPLVKQAIQTRKAPLTWHQQFEQLFKKLEALLPEETASLLHGDLWQGNVLINSVGAPCLIDPAVYFGHREADIAMTRLFVEFDPLFYKAYQEAYPLIPGFGKRFQIYNLYPLLVHLHLFGSSYVAPIQSTLNAFA